MDSTAASTCHSRLRLLTPLAVVFSCGLLGYMAVMDPSGPGDRHCRQAHTKPCVDTLGADVSIRYHQDASTVSAVCGDVRSNACALRTFSFGTASCDIHILESVAHRVLEHELNHCRGWDHAGDTEAAYEAPWHLNREAWVVRGAYR